jgi:hypothetical protein
MQDRRRQQGFGDSAARFRDNSAFSQSPHIRSHTMQRRIAFALAVACTVPTAAWADFRAEFESTQASDKPGLARIELSGKKLRMDAGSVTMLFDGDSGRKIVVMHDKHQYVDLDKVAQSAGAAMARANAPLASLPPEQRAMVEKQMGNRMPGGGGTQSVVRMIPTGVSDHVAGFQCEVYRTEIDGRHIQDSCLADSAAAGISAADRASTHLAFEQMKTFGEKMSGGNYKAPIIEMPIDKFPVQVTRYDDSGNATHVSQLKSLTTAGIGSDDFAIPTDYSEQEIGGPARHH